MSEIKPAVHIEHKQANITESKLHILPCQLDYTGPANVSSFFPQQADANGWTSFRGHILQPSTIKFPSGFQLNILQKTEDTAEHYVVENTQSDLNCWERDEPTPFTTHFQKSLDYLKVASALAIADDYK